MSGIAIGCVLLLQFFLFLPDGKLHLVFCDVGQGDAAYVRLPDGRDMLVDGGPNDRVEGCLGRHMPFWDRRLNLVVLTHPQKDHLQGLVEVLRRFRVDYFVHSDIANATDGYRELMTVLKQKSVPEKLVSRGENISIGRTKLVVLWPSDEQLALGKTGNTLGASVGLASPDNLNDYSVVLLLDYGSFQALLPGDADNHVNQAFVGRALPDNTLEVLKVPHHGSRTGMTSEFLDWLKPRLAVISVGKNSYGHPAPEILQMLKDRDIKTLRTDQAGDIEVVSDGKNWEVRRK